MFDGKFDSVHILQDVHSFVDDKLQPKLYPWNWRINVCINVWSK